MGWFYLLSLSVTTVLTLYYYFTRTFNYWKVRNVSSPKPVPLFGNILQFTLHRQFIGLLYKKIYDQFPNEKVVGIYRMTTPCLLIRDLDIIKDIMIKDFNQFIDRGIEFSEKCLGSNLFHTDGDTWQLLRNRFTPLFTSGKLKNMTYLLTERADKFTDYVDRIVSKNIEQEVHKLVQLFTLTTISACAFGLDINIGDDQVELLKSFDENLFKMNYLTELDMMYPGILKKLNLSLFPLSVRKFFYNLVKTVMNKRNSTPSGRNDFMDLILQLRQQNEIVGAKRDDQKEQVKLKITEDVIASQAFIFYVGGYETSATTMSFMLYHLARNQDIQNKLIAEVDEVLQKHNGQITYDSINDMTYMDNVFAETLRLHFIGDALLRIAKSDYRISGTDVVVKKGQTVLITPAGIQSDPKYYPNPETFDPDRFRAENVRNLHPCAYLSFGIGPRNCIGMRFAKLQSRVCMAKFLSKYRVEPSKNTPKEFDYKPRLMVLCPKSGIPLNIIPRAVPRG